MYSIQKKLKKFPVGKAVFGRFFREKRAKTGFRPLCPRLFKPVQLFFFFAPTIITAATPQTSIAAMAI